MGVKPRQHTPDARPVLYVLKRFPRISETFVLRELLALEAAGVRLLIDSLLPPEPQPRHPELETLRAELRYLPRPPRLRDRAVALAHLRVAARAPHRWIRLATRARGRDRWKRFLQAGLAAERARRERVRHIHAHFATAASEVARDAAALARLPFTVTAHAKDIYQRDNVPQLASRIVGAAAIVTISDYNARHLRAELPGVPVLHVPNGVPVAQPAAVPREGPVLCVARLIPKKGIDVLIEAFALLDAEFPATRLEIIGDGPLADELVSLTHDRRIGQRIDLRGFVSSDAVDDALGRCALLALPCRVAPDGDRDGIPMVLLEALARALPVVSTPVTGIPEVIVDDVTGLLVPPDDPQALADAIRRLLHDRELAARLGAAGRASVAERFDPDVSARRLRELFGVSGRGEPLLAQIE